MVCFLWGACGWGGEAACMGAGWDSRLPCINHTCIIQKIHMVLLWPSSE
jgi:hypothetical protein